MDRLSKVSNSVPLLARYIVYVHFLSGMQLDSCIERFSLFIVIAVIALTVVILYSI